MSQNKKPSRILALDRVVFVILFLFAIGYFVYDRFKEEPPQSIPSIPKTEIAGNTGLRDSIVAFGMEQLGTPYVAAGCSKDGFDCSGFVFFVFQNFDIKVPRSSAEFEHYGREIPIDKVEKGDLLLFLSPTRDVIGHMGIVSKPAGMATEFMHATSGKQMQVVVSSLATNGYTKRFVKAVRVL